MGLQTENLILSSKLVKLLESHEREYVKFSSGHIEKFIVKPQYQMALHENLTKWSALDKYCVQNGWGLLITDGYRSIQKFQQHEFSMEFQTALLTTLENSRDGTISWIEYRRIRDQHSATWSDFLAVILKNGLVWSLQPFVLKQKVPSSSQEF